MNRVNFASQRNRWPRILIVAILVSLDLAPTQAQECGESQLDAGVQFPSDVSAGLELGRKVAELVIARAKTDGSDAVFI